MTKNKNQTEQTKQNYFCNNILTPLLYDEEQK